MFVSTDSMSILCDEIASRNQCPDGCSVKHAPAYQVMSLGSEVQKNCRRNNVWDFMTNLVMCTIVKD